MNIIQRINNHLNALAPHVAQRQTATLLRDAVAEIELLNKDKQRLDWLADRENLIGNVQLPTDCVTDNLHDMRAAIDQAMKSNG